MLVLLPFCWRGGGKLAACASISSIEELQELKQRILRRYLADERTWREKQLRARVWQKRQLFLCNCYVDVCRRLDFLQQVGKVKTNDTR